MSFTERFQISLESLFVPLKTTTFVVAYSGGIDSRVLLHCCKKLNLSVRAVHVHHGLQSKANEWVTHCQNTCEGLGVPIDVIYVDANKKKGESPEETARNVRYTALQSGLVAGEVLLTAQHRDDQAETLLLQLFRSASSAGLAAMPASKLLGDHLHLRPFLSFSRNEIENFAKQNALVWIEDPSNQDEAFDRNFIRKSILPSLEERWPEVKSQLSTVASLQAKNLEVLENMAAIDMANALSTQKTRGVFETLSILSIDNLVHLSSSRLLNLLRYWIINTLQKQPTKKLLKEIEGSLIQSQPDANPDIVFSNFSFKKFQGNLYLIKTNNATVVQKDVGWNPSVQLDLPDLNIQIKAILSMKKGLNNQLLDELLYVRFRKGGEKFHPANRQHSQSLKKLLQEANVPPWERDVVPLIYFGDELIAVGGLWIAKAFAVSEGENGWVVGVEHS